MELLLLLLGLASAALPNSSEMLGLVLQHSQLLEMTGQRSRSYCSIEDGPLCFLDAPPHSLEEESARVRSVLEKRFSYKIDEKKTFNVLESLLGSEESKSFGGSEPFLVNFSRALGLDPLEVRFLGEVNLSKPAGEEQLETGGRRQKLVQVVGETGQLGLTLLFERPIYFKAMKYKTVGPSMGDVRRRLQRIVGSLGGQEVFAFDLQAANLWKDLSLE